IQEKNVLNFYQSLSATAEYPSSELQSSFDNMGKLLLNNLCLIAGGQSYYLCEIEFYFFQRDFHPDTYSHYAQYPNAVGNKQSVIGGWYFHRFRSMANYAHTRRGLDITFGSTMAASYGGMLLRSIQRINDGKVVSGPSDVVGEILMEVSDPDQLTHIALHTYDGAVFD